jgi:hypothetical protein
MAQQDETPAPTPAEPDPDAAARAKAERLEREREQLLLDIAAATTEDIRTQVGYVLSHYPEARDSDVRLAHRLWETFYPEYIEDGMVRLEDMFHLPREKTITRTRAKIQNEYGLFQPSGEVAAYRQGLRDETKEQVRADKPGPPVLSIYADESSKTQGRYLVIGSVWGLDVARIWRVVRELEDWKRQESITGEFKFSELTTGRLPRAQAFVKKAMEYSALIGLKACVLDTYAVPGLKGEERLYRLYYELAVGGLEHEIDCGRVVLPRWLHLVKDEDAGPDALHLPELERRLKVACQDYFKDSVRVDSVITGRSDRSPLLQLADLFAGSVARRFNKEGETENAKDAFAAFFQTVAGFDFVHAEEGEDDSVHVRHLGGPAEAKTEPQLRPMVEVTDESGLLELPGL